MFQATGEISQATDDDGCTFTIAPSGDPQGPFFISIVKLTSPNSKKVNVWPISTPIATHDEAMAQLRLGFELDMAKLDSALQSLFTRAVGHGLIMPVMPFHPEEN